MQRHIFEQNLQNWLWLNRKNPLHPRHWKYIKVYLFDNSTEIALNKSFLEFKMEKKWQLCLFDFQSSSFAFPLPFLFPFLFPIFVVQLSPETLKSQIQLFTISCHID
jgi:hypothetical protein